jgi:hypothetical protein
MLSGMFVVSEAEAAAIRAAFERDGEFAAAVELRRLFPGIADTEQAREYARTIAGWKPLQLPLRPVKRLPKPAALRWRYRRLALISTTSAGARVRQAIRRPSAPGAAPATPPSEIPCGVLL